MSELGSLRVGPEIEETAGVAPETRLFRHIILTALLDAVYGSGVRASEDRKVRSDALRWFMHAGEDFRFVCECADLHPQTVQRNALRYIHDARENPPTHRRASINFTPNEGRLAA